MLVCLNGKHKFWIWKKYHKRLKAMLPYIISTICVSGDAHSTQMTNVDMNTEYEYYTVTKYGPDVHILSKVWHFQNSKVVGSKRSDQRIGSHFAFRYGLHDETSHKARLSSQWSAVLKCFGWLINYEQNVLFTQTLPISAFTRFRLIKIHVVSLTTSTTNVVFIFDFFSSFSFIFQRWWKVPPIEDTHASVAININTFTLYWLHWNQCR